MWEDRLDISVLPLTAILKIIERNFVNFKDVNFADGWKMSWELVMASLKVLSPYFPCETEENHQE
jgi:hypothetical protein